MLLPGMTTKAWLNRLPIFITGVENISEEGLPDKIPYKQEFAELMGNNGIDSTGHPSVPAELMLSTQYFLYASNVWGGISEKQSNEMKWYLPRKKVSFALLLDSLINGKNILDSAPVFRQYALLKEQLKKIPRHRDQWWFPCN